jgi:hypothetical protein
MLAGGNIQKGRASLTIAYLENGIRIEKSRWWQGRDDSPASFFSK